MASFATAPQAASLSARAAVRGARASRKTAVARRAARATVRAAISDPPSKSIKEVQRPDESGRYGDYGGKYVPETLIPALLDLEREYAALATDEAFQVRAPPREPSNPGPSSNPRSSLDPSAERDAARARSRATRRPDPRGDRALSRSHLASLGASRGALLFSAAVPISPPLALASSSPSRLRPSASPSPRQPARRRG